MTQEEQKQAAAEAALEFIELGDVIGVGTGSTTNYFIDALAQVKGKLDGAVASSEASATRLTAMGIPFDKINSSIRFSFGWSNTTAEIEKAVKILAQTVSLNRTGTPADVNKKLKKTL